MPDHTLLVLELRDLTNRLNTGKVKFLDVLKAVDQRLVIADGCVHPEQDALVLDAITELARAIAEAWYRDSAEIIKDTSLTIARGVSTGRYGPEFFKRIRP